MPTNRAPERERNPQQVRCPGVAAAWLPATPSESRSDLSRTLPTVMAAPCSLGSGEFQKFRGFFLFQLSSRSNYYTVSYGNANRFLCLTFVSQTLRQADVILWLYFVMTSCIHFTILQLILQLLGRYPFRVAVPSAVNLQRIHGFGLRFRTEQLILLYTLRTRSWTRGGPGHERPTLSTGPVTQMVRPRASAENKSLGLRFARMVSVLRTT